MSSSEHLDLKAPPKSPPLSPRLVHLANFSNHSNPSFLSYPSNPTPTNPTEANGSLNETPEVDEKSVKKEGAKPAVVSGPLSNPVSSASLHSVSPASALNGQLNAGPTVINKQLLSKLNKSLKEKQKIINGKESHTRVPTVIQDVMSPALQHSFNVSGSSSSEIGLALAPNNVPLNESIDLDRADADISNSSTVAGKDDFAVKAKNKQVAKQNSTRTDFFAAKLAIAVDDVESSDSDETFIYETNVNEFGDSEPSGLPAPAALPVEELRKPGHSSTTDIANQKFVISHPANDAVSLNGSGSVRIHPSIDSHPNSPITELRRDDDSYSFMLPPSQPLVTKAESIHSLQSVKYNLRNTFNTTPPGNGNSRSQSVNHNSIISSENPAFSNPYFECHPNKEGHKPPGHEGVPCSLNGDEKNASIRYSVPNYGDPTLMSYRINEPLAHSHEPYTDGNFSYDEEDEGSSDDGSSHCDANLICIDANTNKVLPPIAHKPADLVSVSSKAKKNKSTTNSSKLRSTTSKLFDKKGAQPRRYSTIPDDIDIEDFDDELIYYDNNNIRFPYGNHNDNSNESSSLISGPKIPHYRSLNLNFGSRKPSKHIRPQRFLSLGYATPSNMNNGNSKRKDIFPFPYLENETPYLDFDEYNEDPQRHQGFRSKRIGSNRTQFSYDGNHILPRFASQSEESGRAVLFRTLIYLFIGISFILSLGFILGFFLASTKDLTNVSIVSIQNALVSQDELVFSIVIEALNPGWFAISLSDLELDIFAKSGYLGEPSIESSLETVLLGSVLNFESEVTFEGMFFHRKLIRQTGEVKLVSPGKNITGSESIILADSLVATSLTDAATRLLDNSDKWAIISKHPFDLILRGVLKYNLPLTSAPKTVVVNKVGYVDPSVPS